MIFNVTKINNRVFLDKGDIITALLKLSKSTRIDEPSTAVIVKLLEFVSETFDSAQPTERTIVPTYVIDYSLIASLNKIYKKNQSKKKRRKNDEELQQGLIDLEAPKPVEEAFNVKQVGQLQEIIKAQNELIQKLLLEQVKVIKELIPAVPEEAKKISKEPKPKKAATT